MQTIRNAAIAFCLFACELHAQAVIQNLNLTFGATSGPALANYAFTVYQNAAGTNPTARGST